MEDTRILTITGTNSSGKTTLSFKIAKELEKQDKDVCIVSFDELSPLSTIKDNYDNYNVSIGYMLTKDTTTTQRDIYTSMIPITNKISIISYVYGDTKDKYSKILSNRVRDFIDLLSGIVDYIIIDGGSNIIKPEIRQCCQMSNKIINVLEPNYKSIAYYKTFTQLLDRIDVDSGKITNIINKVFYDTDYKKYTYNIGLKYYIELPYLEEIVKEYNNPLKKLEKRIHETEKYNRNFKRLITEVYKIEYENIEVYESKIEIKEKQEIKYESRTANNIEKKINELKDKEENNINKNTNINKENKKMGLFSMFGKPKREKPMPKPQKMYIEGDEF